MNLDFSKTVTLKEGIGFALALVLGGGAEYVQVNSQVQELKTEIKLLEKDVATNQINLRQINQIQEDVSSIRIQQGVILERIENINRDE